MFGLGFQELLVVGVVAVVLFGKRLPEVAKSLGSSYREFRQGLSEIQSQMDWGSTTRSFNRSYLSKPTPSYRDDSNDFDRPSGPKFELPSPSAQEAEVESTN